VTELTTFAVWTRRVVRRIVFTLVITGVLVFASPAQAQELEVWVYSEFRRVDPFGQIIPQDRGGQIREILSPLVARNSYATFRLVVWAPPGQFYYLYVGTNPAQVFEIDVYKELWTKQGDQWIPDRLVPVNLPHRGHVPDPYHGIPNQKVETFLIDIWVPKTVSPGRVRLEPQIALSGRWAIYPMEIRVSDVVAPDVKPQPPLLVGPELPSDRAVLSLLKQYLCGIHPKGRRVRELTGRALIWRNAVRDLAIAREQEAERGREAVRKGLVSGLGVSPEEFCRAEVFRSPHGPEWYLVGRDFLYRRKVDY